MSLIEKKITEYTDRVVELDNRPSIGAGDLKKWFDSNSEEARAAINGMIDDLVSASGSSYIGAEEITAYLNGPLGDNVKEQIESIVQYLDTHAKAAVLAHPDGSVTAPKIALNAVTADKIAGNAVSDDKIGSRQIQDPSADSGTATAPLTALLNSITAVVRALRSGKADKTDTYTKAQTDTGLAAKIGEAPVDGKQYLRSSAAWQTLNPVGLPVIVVAAANSGEYDKGRADLVCTGAGDQEMMAQAVGLLPKGGTVQLCGGDYYFALQSGPLLNLGEHITLQGVYGKTVILAPEYIEGGDTPTCAIQMGSASTIDGLELMYTAGNLFYDTVGYSSILAIGDNMAVRNTRIIDFAGYFTIGSNAAYHENFIMDNVSLLSLDGVDITKMKKTTIQNCNLEKSSVRDFGGALSANYCDDFELINTTLVAYAGTTLGYSGSRAKVNNNTMNGSYFRVNAICMKIYDNEVTTAYEGSIVGSSNKIHDNNFVGQQFTISGERVHFHDNTLSEGLFAASCTNSQINQNIFNDCTIDIGWRNIIMQNFFGGSIVDNDTSYELGSSNYLANNYYTSV